MNRLLTREEIFEGKILHVYKDIVEIEENLTVEEKLYNILVELVSHLKIMMVNSYFVKQFRYAQQEETIEFPAGKKEQDEDFT